MNHPDRRPIGARETRRRRAGSEFDRFVDEHAADLLRCAYLVVWDLPAAEDLVQECLVRLARRWPKVRAMEFPGAYARRVLFNLALDSAPKRDRHRRELQPGAEELNKVGDTPAFRAFASVEERSQLESALGLLAPRQRAVLVLRYLEDLSEAQTAAMLGCSVGTVKNTTWHALERLRHLMAQADSASPLAPAMTPGAGRSS